MSSIFKALKKKLEEEKTAGRNGSTVLQKKLLQMKEEADKNK